MTFSDPHLSTMKSLREAAARVSQSLVLLNARANRRTCASSLALLEKIGKPTIAEALGQIGSPRCMFESTTKGQMQMFLVAAKLGA